MSRLGTLPPGSMWSLPPATSVVAAYWIESEEFDTIVEAERREAIARQRLAAKVLVGRQRLVAGYHYWLELPPQMTSESFTLAAQARGVLVTPSATFWLGSSKPPGAVRLSLSAAPDRASLNSALQLLKQIFLGRRSSGRRRVL